MPVESNNNQSDSNNTKENPLFDALRREFVEKKDRGNNKKKATVLPFGLILRTQLSASFSSFYGQVDLEEMKKKK